MQLGPKQPSWFLKVGNKSWCHNIIELKIIGIPNWHNYSEYKIIVSIAYLLNVSGLPSFELHSIILAHFSR